MKILVLTTAYSPFVGGAEIAIENIVDQIRDKDFIILTPRLSEGLPDKEVKANHTIIRLGFGKGFDKHIFPILSLYWYMKNRSKENISFIWCMMANQAGVAAWLVNKIFSTPYLLTLQEGDPKEWVDKRRRMMLGLYEAIYRKASRIQVISEHLKARAVGLGANADLVSVVPNGINTDVFRSIVGDKKALRHELSLPENKFIFFTSSRLVKKNGVDICIEALQNVDALLVIAGDGEDRKYLESLVVRYNVQHKIIFLGTISQGKVARLLQASDCFIRLSRSEGLGISFLESFATGTPVIATNVDAIPEIVKDEFNGLLVDSENATQATSAMNRMIEDVELRELLSKNAISFIEKYDWKKVSVLINQIFTKMQMKVSSKKINVLVATPMIHPQIGGPATYCKFLDIHSHGSDIQFEFLSFHEYLKYPKIVRHVRYFFDLYRRSVDSDMIYAFDPVSIGLPALIVTFIRRNKLMVKVVGDYAWEQGVDKYNVREKCEVFWDHRYGMTLELLKKLEAFVCRSADLVIVPSNFTKNIVKRFGVDSWDIKVINNSVETPSVIADKLPHKIVTAGRLISLKGVDAIIDGVKLLKKDFPSVELLIIGDGPYKKTLEDRIISEQLSDTVKMTGKKDTLELLQEIKSARIFILNSMCENYSHILLESLSVGTVVIASNVGGNSEIIEDGKNGYLFEHNNVEQMTSLVKKVFNDTDIESHFAVHNKLFIESLNSGEIYQKLATEIKSLMIKE